MGFKTTDVAPNASYGPTVTTPFAKDVAVKAFQVSRTDTTAVIKAVLPADATIIDIRLVGVASNAGTTGLLNIGTTAAANELLVAQDVRAVSGMTRPTTSFNQAVLPNLEFALGSGDIPLYAKYVETGAASSAGGPWTVIVEYVR